MGTLPIAIIICFAFLIFVGLVTAKNKSISGGKADYSNKKPLSNVEQIAYWRIKEAIGDDKIVLAQVAFSSFIRTKGSKDSAYRLFAKARQKVADFVICNKDFTIFAIIEIDDKTHDKNKDADRDLITESAGIKTLRYEASKLPTTAEFKKEIESCQKLMLL